eukprot:4248637-Amphidinium_carterae.1
MGRMNIKLPTPTQFDGKNPHFNEWAGEVNAYVTIHSVYFEDYMNKSTKSIEAVNISEIQDEYTAQDVTEWIQLNNKFQQRPDRDNNDANDEYNDVQLSIRKKRDDQSLNYVLAHSTKPGSDAHSIV